jgi:hypothetical protein
MNTRETVKEVLLAILPITIIIAILNFALIKLPTETFLNFLGGSVMVIIGFILFLLGIKSGFLPMGESIGSKVVSKGKTTLMVLTAFILGFVVTFAEPDVQVLAMQADQVTAGAVDKIFIVSAISLGVGIFLALAIAKILFRIRIIFILLAGYLIIFILTIFTSPDYLSLAFDSGGVTTGPMTVPFILSLGIGVAAVASDRKDSGSSFGLVGLASVGPVLAVLIMGVIMR